MRIIDFYYLYQLEKHSYMKNKLLIMLAFLLANASMKAQDYLDDIMFQSFGWDEFAQTRVSNEGGLYEFYNARTGVLKANGVDMIWLPPPSASTGDVGYFPTEWFNFSKTSWGTEAQLRKMLANMNARGLYPIADVVVNHRNGTTGWTDFTNPTWGCETICNNDDAASASYVGCRPSGAADTGEEFKGSRDLDHTNLTVQNGVKDFLSRLKALGFKGWRWDVAKGFAPVYFGNYIQASQPYYSVGENWDGNATKLKNWIDGTYAGGINSSTTVSGAFDFSTYYALSGALKTNNFTNLKNSFTGAMNGLAGQIGYAEKAVTFVDNHDTFVKTEAILGNNIPKAYAYILTHPGIPCVFAPHYYGGSYTKDGVPITYSNYSTIINKLMIARKTAGIDAWSSVTIDQSVVGLYAAYIKKRNSDTDPVIAMKIGSNSWSPSGTGWVLAASDTDYAVWLKTAINVPPVVDITPIGGVFAAGTPKSITINGSDDSLTTTPTYYYTTDGSDPTISSTKYTGAFSVSTNTTVKAIAIDNLGLSSGVLERDYEFKTPKDVVVRFKPPTTTPNWPLPKIHYWGYTPTTALPAASWGTPINMTADVDNPGWFKYTFPNVSQVSFLFRDGNATGTLGVTKTGDIVNVTQDSWYEWDPTSSTFVKLVNNLSTDEVKNNKANLTLLQNPVVNGVAQVRLNNAKNGMLSILDVSGKLLKTQRLSKDSGDEAVSVSGLKSGLYILQLNSDKGTSTVKMIIK